MISYKKYIEINSLLKEEYKNFYEITSTKYDFKIEESIKDYIYNQKISDLVNWNIINIPRVDEGFTDFKNKLKDAVGDINQKIIDKVDNVINDIKSFVVNASKFLGAMFDSIWDFAKKNMNIYVKNIVNAFKNSVDITKKGFNDEIDWVKKIFIWFQEDFKDFFMNLFKKSITDGVNESLYMYSEFSNLIFENDNTELEKDKNVDNMFTKLMDNIKKSRAFHLLQQFFDVLMKISKSIEKGIEQNANKVLTFCAATFEKIKGLPKSPGDFLNSSKIFTLCVLQIAKNEGLDKGYIEPKKLSFILIKKFTKIFLRGIIPGVDGLLLALKIKSYFILFGTVMKTLSA